MTFAEKLRELRDAKGLSEAKLASASGLKFGMIHSYGLGIRKPSFAAVVQIARALGVSCEAFADCDDMKGVEGEYEKKPASKTPRKRGKK